MKKSFLVIAIAVALMCLFAITAFAATPDTTRETFTLTDGTVLPVWDTDGNALIWYISATDSETGVKTYKCVSVVDTTPGEGKASIDFPCNYVSGSKIQLGEPTITDENGATFNNKTIVLANLVGGKITSATKSDYNGGIGKEYTCFAQTFQSSTNIEYVKLPAKTYGIYANVFTGCTNLRYINFNELTELRSLAGSTFKNTTKLAVEADFSNSMLEDIGSACFENSAITTLVFPTGGTFKSIGHYALQGIPNITEIHIPDSVTSIGKSKTNSHTFKDCTSLEKVTGFASLFERGVLTYIPGYMFVNCTSLEELDMPTTGYTAIYTSAFQYCDNLFTGVDFVVPETCTSIGGTAFEKTNIVTVRLNGSYTSIAANTFRDCSDLTTIYMSSTITAFEGEALRGLPSNTTIFFVGDKTAAETLKSNVVGNLNGSGASYNNAIVDATIKSLEEYNAIEDKTTGRYIVYGVNRCDAFYNSNHTVTGTDCTKDDTCKICALPIAKQAEHTLLEALVYANGFTENGVYTCDCTFNGCTAANIKAGDEGSSRAPLFNGGEGFSTKGEDGIAGGYTINVDGVNEYKRINGSLTFGIMVVNPNYYYGKDSFFDTNGKVNTSGGALQVEFTNNRYQNVNVSLTGFAGAEGLSLVIALYAYDDAENVEFIQSTTTKCGDKNVTVGGETLYTVTLASVKAGANDLSSLGDYEIKEPQKKEEQA